MKLRAFRGRSAGQPVTVTPVVVKPPNARLVWKEDGATRSDNGYCTGAIVDSRPQGECFDLHGTRIQNSDILFARALSNIALPPDPRPDCRPVRVSSQADVDAWNAAHPTCTPMPSFEAMCPTTGRPTDRDGIIAWNTAHPQCAPITVPPAKKSIVGPVVLGVGALIALGLALTAKPARSNPRRRSRHGR